MKRISLILVVVAGVAMALPTQPFALSQVRLMDGIFKDSMEVNRKVLDEIGVERALYAYRIQAGLPTGDTKSLGSWAAPEPNGPFPGFFEGHYLSGISLMAAQTGDSEMHLRVDYMVAELKKCQHAQGGGYLFASPEAEFDPDRLDGVVWYRMHKLMEGLLDAHQHAGNGQALEILNNLADWIDGRVKEYWDQFERVKMTEFGGMTEAFERLYESTHNDRDRNLALVWEQREKILDKFHRNEDFMEHANTLLAKMVGAARIAQNERDHYHETAVANFWELVAGSGRKTYATGGTSVHEGMPAVGSLADTQANMAQETCVSYNLLKVTDSLYQISGHAKYMDYHERGLYNAILGSQDAETGWKTYYQPLAANSLKDFRSNLTGCYCCNGTGLENSSEYGSFIYSHDDSGLRVNLFIPSVLNWPEKGIQLSQETKFPAEPSTSLVIKARRPTDLAIGIRVPEWCLDGFAVSVNGESISGEAKPGSYVTVRRTWNSGDRIDCKMPMTFSKYVMPDKPDQMAFMYGPLVMVGDGARTYLSELVGDPDDPENWVNHLDQWFKPVKGQPLHFTATDDAGRETRFRPYYEIGGGVYFTGYWDVVKTASRRVENNIALGKPVTCSTPDPSGVNVEAFLRAGKAVDGQYGGKNDWYVKWFPNGMPPQWISVDLGELTEISGTRWIPAAGDIKDKVAYCYQIESSEDGKSWQDYVIHDGNMEALEFYVDTKPVKARYMKLTILPPAAATESPTRPKVAEFEVISAGNDKD